MLHILFEKLIEILKVTNKNYEIICIDDGSTDDTLPKLRAFASQDERIKIIAFSRNFGKEAALTAGLGYASGEDIVPMDADLQDPPELIIDFLRKREEGFDVVVGLRVDRNSDTFFKKFSAELYYRIFNFLSPQKIQTNVGDFRLMSRRVVQEILKLSERDRFMKGLFSWVGFPTTAVEYCRPKRAAGKSKWGIAALLNHGVSGICSFTATPLRLWTYTGFLFFGFAMIYILFVVLKKLIIGDPVAGYSSMMVIILLIGGIQSLGLGVMGEYIARLVVETKRRTLYIVAETINCPRRTFAETNQYGPERD